MCDFRETPEARVAGLIERLVQPYRAGQALATRILESLQVETLDDSGVTSAENNSSAILFVWTDGQALLFTGDAGIPALTRAADYAALMGIDMGALRFLQVPHHGSRRNVGPTILNRIKGSDSLPLGQQGWCSQASLTAGGECPHPAGNECLRDQRGESLALLPRRPTSRQLRPRD